MGTPIFGNAEAELDHAYQLANDYRELIDSVPKVIEGYLLPWLDFALTMTRDNTTYDLAKFMKEMLESLVKGIAKDIERVEQDTYSIEDV